MWRLYFAVLVRKRGLREEAVDPEGSDGMDLGMGGSNSYGIGFCFWERYQERVPVFRDESRYLGHASLLQLVATKCNCG